MIMGQLWRIKYTFRPHLQVLGPYDNPTLSVCLGLVLLGPLRGSTSHPIQCTLTSVVVWQAAFWRLFDV